MQIIYSYLVSTLLPSYVDIDLQMGSMPAGSTSSVYKHGTFVTKGSITRDSKSVVEKVNILITIYMDPTFSLIQRAKKKCRIFIIVLHF